MLELQIGADRPTTIRVARAAVMNQDHKIYVKNRANAKRQAAAGGCCTCQRGPPGPAGKPGVDGQVLNAAILSSVTRSLTAEWYPR